MGKKLKAKEPVVTFGRLEKYVDYLNQEVILDWNKRHGYMTGQEFYDRFVKEWGEWPEEDCCGSGVYCGDQIHINMQRAGLKAAKKAAGIE